MIRIWCIRYSGIIHLEEGNLAIGDGLSALNGDPEIIRGSTLLMLYQLEQLIHGNRHPQRMTINYTRTLRYRDEGETYMFIVVGVPAGS